MDHSWIDSLRTCGWVREFLDVVFPDEQRDVAYYENGAITVVRRVNPEPGSENWLHTFYPGLIPSVLANLDIDFGMRYSNPDVMSVGIAKATGYRGPIPGIPDGYREFLRIFNGMRLFGGHLAMYGVRKMIGGDAEVNRQPFGIDDENIFRRPRNLSGEYLVIGGYAWDGTRVCMACSDSRIVHVARSGAEILGQWTNLESMLIGEARRLNERFTQAGELIDPASSTAPSW